MKELLEQFIDRYLTRSETAYRLPVRTTINTFWPQLLEERNRRTILLPLKTQSGEHFRYVLNKTIEQQSDRVAEIARSEIAFEFSDMIDNGDGLIDEAVWSSVIEGAFTSRAEAANLIRKNTAPSNKSEQMIRNNYNALLFVLDHLEDRITKQTLVDIARILTRDASEETVTDYRIVPVYVTGSQGVIYEPPTADAVPQMMDDLINFINNDETHPIIKACAAHFYLVYVHPFTDGNGRTARALSYMILLRSGYDFFRYFSISGMIAEERSRYYKSILNVEDEANGGNDMTYFIDFYTSMLSRTVEKSEIHLKRSVISDLVSKRMESARGFNARQIAGITWMLKNDFDHVSVEQWKKKHKIATETARRDLIALADAGLMTRNTEGKKVIFSLPGSAEFIRLLDNIK